MNILQQMQERSVGGLVATREEHSLFQNTQLVILTQDFRSGSDIDPISILEWTSLKSLDRIYTSICEPKSGFNDRSLLIE